jgi:hypothetical protein
MSWELFSDSEATDLAVNQSAVPEPVAIVIVGLGLLLAGAFKPKRK